MIRFLDIKQHFYVSVIFLAVLFFCFSGCNARKLGELSEVVFETEDGVRIIGTLFNASKKKAVIFVHGSVYTKESWYPLAKKFQKKGVTSLTFNLRGSKGLRPINIIHEDVSAALKFMTDKGVKEISVVAAGIGASATLDALGQKVDYPIDTIILIAPQRGTSIEDSRIKKIFIVSQNDPVKEKVGEIYDNCSEPKFIKIFPGNLHAQSLFESDFKTNIEDYIIAYIAH